MRHGKKVNHLSRKKGHRRALLANLASQLIEYKRITTTVAKAKALRVYVEPLITRSKNDTTHNRRVVFSYLQNKEAIKELFGDVSNRVGDRPGGYTRILRTDRRAGDNTEMCIIELVDFNESYVFDKKSTGTKKKRTRRGGKKAEDTVTATAAIADEAVDFESTDVEEIIEDTTEEAVEDTTEEGEFESADVEEIIEDTTEEAVEDTTEEGEFESADVEEIIEDTTEEVVEDATEEVIDEVEGASEEAIEGVVEETSEEVVEDASEELVENKEEEE